MGSKRKDVEEVPPEAQMRKDAEEVSPKAQKRKKPKASKPITQAALTEDDYNLIATRLQDEMQESFQKMQTLQDKIHSTLDKQLQELKALTEKTALMQTQSVKVKRG